MKRLSLIGLLSIWLVCSVNTASEVRKLSANGLRKMQGTLEKYKVVLGAEQALKLSHLKTHINGVCPQGLPMVDRESILSESLYGAIFDQLKNVGIPFEDFDGRGDEWAMSKEQKDEIEREKQVVKILQKQVKELIGYAIVCQQATCHELLIWPREQEPEEKID